MSSRKQKCIDMWQWLRDNPGISDKDEYFKEMGIIEIPPRTCYACAACHHCNSCPIKWPRRCNDGNSPYFRWCMAKTDNERCFYANQVVILIVETWVVSKNERESWV